MTEPEPPPCGTASAAAGPPRDSSGSCAVPGRAVDESAKAIRKYLDDLRLEVEQLEASVKELQQQALPKSSAAQPSSASINVGGDTGFVLSSDQFEAFPKSLLNSLCTGRWSSLHSLDHEGRIFLDLDPAQFRAILDWAFENAERSERPRLAEASEPQTWGLDLLIRFLGLAEHQAVEPKVKIDPEDGTVCTYPEILCKYSKEYSGDEIRDYWLYSMEQARNAMPCYRPVVFAGVPLREQAQQHLDPLSCLLADHIRAIQDEGAELRQRKAQAQEELESLESERTGLKLLGGASRLDEDSPDIVYFNAAGRLLATSRQTLLHCKGSMLERWFGGDWTLQESEKLGQAVRIDQDSETFASVLQILRFHRIFGPAALPVGQPCRKSKLPLLRQALSYFQLEQVKGTGKGKGKHSASAWLSPNGLEALQMPRREEVYEASSDTNSPVRWEVAVEVAL